MATSPKVQSLVFMTIVQNSVRTGNSRGITARGIVSVTDGLSIPTVYRAVADLTDQGYPVFNSRLHGGYLSMKGDSKTVIAMLHADQVQRQELHNREARRMKRAQSMVNHTGISATQVHLPESVEPKAIEA